VRKGDTVVVRKLGRLARNTLHILETVMALTDHGVTLVSVTDGIDSSTAAGRMMIGVLGSLAEYERELTKERTALDQPIIVHERGGSPRIKSGKLTAAEATSPRAAERVVGPVASHS